MHLIDLIIIIVYMAGIVVTGILTRGRQESSDDYFAAGGNMRGVLGSLVVGLSVAATYFSGISFVAFPSLTISEGAKVLFFFVALIPCAILVPFWFIPRYLSFASFHPYAIITARIGPKARGATSALFVLLRIGWMASLIYAPTIVLLTMLNLEPGWMWPIVLIIGLSSTFYTVFSGLRGVIITDAIQMLIILFSLLAAVIFGLSQVPFNPSAWWDQLSTQGKLALPSFSLSLSERFTIWGFIIGVSISNLATYVADQMSLQRYIATGSVKSAQRAFLCNMLGVFCVLTLLLMMGLVIAIWRAYHPDVPWPASADRAFPNFIATIFPPGLTGLIVAAILAATMSSITSGINALAGAITSDFIRPANPGAPPRFYLTVGRWVSVCIGVLSTVGAGFAARLGSLFDVSQAILGVFLGPIFGVMVLAMLNRPVSERRVLIGMVVACVIGIGIAFSTVQSIWITIIGASTCLLVAYPWGSGRTLTAAGGTAAENLAAPAVRGD